VPHGIPEGSAGEGKKLREAARHLVRGDFQREDDIQKEEDRLAEQLAFFGLQPDAPVLPEVEPFYLWPEHVEPYMLFASLRTQWRHGFAGPTGLDYGAVLAHMAAARLPEQKFDWLYECVRIMEQGALEGFTELRQEQEGR
jgi:hypothetical protein